MASRLDVLSVEAKQSVEVKCRVNVIVVSIKTLNDKTLLLWCGRVMSSLTTQHDNNCNDVASIPLMLVLW